MKIYKIKQYIAVAIAAVMLVITGGCAKIDNFGDTNINPNGVSEPILSSLLTNVGIGLSGTVTNRAGGYFSQYYGETTYPGLSRYTPGDVQQEASGNYSGILQDCQVIIIKNQDPNFVTKAAAYGDNANQIAIATMLKTYIMWTVTDRWGDVPYSEALSGAANPLPKYDEQKDIYAGMLKDLTTAVGSMNASGALVKGDLIYGGGGNIAQVTQWRKFGNSLRMLIALRMSKRYPNAGGVAANEFNAALSSPFGHIQTNADNFSVAYPGGVFFNPLSALSTSQDVAVSLTFTDALNGMGDTRIQTMATSANGVPYGLNIAAPVGGTYARITNGAPAAQNAALHIIKASSVLLAKAEAMERGWVPLATTADAKIAYDAGVAQSFAQWFVTMPAGYLTGSASYTSGSGGGSIGGPSVAGSSCATSTKLERIALQQYFAFYPSGLQGWSNWRRTGFPILKPTINPSNPSGQIPRRLLYGATDLTTNKVQVLIAIGRMGGTDSQDAKMWWDQ